MSEIWELQIAALKEFEERLKKPSLKDDALFQEAINLAQQLLGRTQEDIAIRLSCSRATVNRWTVGENAAHPATRKAVFQQLRKQAISRRRQLEKSPS